MSEIVYRIKRNPVLVGAAAMWGYEALSTGSPLTLRSALVVVMGVIVRSRVVPAHEVAIITDFVTHVLEQADKEK